MTRVVIMSAISLFTVIETLGALICMVEVRARLSAVKEPPAPTASSNFEAKFCIDSGAAPLSCRMRDTSVRPSSNVPGLSSSCFTICTRLSETVLTFSKVQSRPSVCSTRSENSSFCAFSVIGMSDPTMPSISSG